MKEPEGGSLAFSHQKSPRASKDAAKGFFAGYFERLCSK
jgi:hypothetical protein